MSAIVAVPAATTAPMPTINAVLSLASAIACRVALTTAAVDAATGAALARAAVETEASRPAGAACTMLADSVAVMSATDCETPRCAKNFRSFQRAIDAHPHAILARAGGGADGLEIVALHEAQEDGVAVGFVEISDGLI